MTSNTKTDASVWGHIGGLGSLELNISESNAKLD